MCSQMDMFEPVLGSLSKVLKEAVPGLLSGVLKVGILLLIDHLYKKTSLAAPERNWIIILRVTLTYIPTVA
jgi:hypothetical protein